MGTSAQPTMGTTAPIVPIGTCRWEPTSARAHRHVSAPLWQREGRHEPCFPETSAIASLPISEDE